jgi:hypothetical protein
MGDNNEAGLSSLFGATSGNTEPTPEPVYDASDWGVGDDFLKNFRTPYTGANGAGPILNANANLMPTVSDEYRDIGNTLDYRLGDGIGVSRAFRKNDSMGGQTLDGFLGPANPSKMFGRDSKSYDLNYKRDEMLERAQAGFKKMGFKEGEVPLGTLFPWEWNDHQALGTGGGPIGNPNQYNRNHSLPDADQAARRLYQPAPSRLTKMVVADVEAAALRPNRTMLHPLKVVTEDPQRQKLQRIPRNTDVREAVTYENIHPRGMLAAHLGPSVYAEADVLRQPVGTNETGDRSVLGRWENGFSSVNPLTHTDLEDRLMVVKNSYRALQGKQPEREAADFRRAADALASQRVPDWNTVQPYSGEYANDVSGVSGPLYVPLYAGRAI